MKVEGGVNESVVVAVMVTVFVGAFEVVKLVTSILGERRWDSANSF